jgi:valacyclovir hydrolase
MPFAELTTGASLHYEDTGAGLPLIVIHGLLGTARDHFGDLIEWLAAQGFRVLGPSMRGYGQSLPKPRDFPYDFYHRDADDLIAFMDKLGIRKAHIIGYSDGGEIALVAAGKYPDRCRSVITIGAIGNFGPELRPVFQRTYPGTWIKEEEKIKHGLDDTDKFALGWVRAMTRMVDMGGDVSLSLAPNVQCPLMILLGEKDTLNPAEYGRRFIENVPHGLGRIEVLRCGHGVHQEMPDEFRKIVGEFLNK